MLTKTLAPFAAATLALLAVSAMATAPAFADASAAHCLDKLIPEDFSGVVWVARGDSVSSREKGVVGMEGSQPITTQTRFNLASASKMFTAVAVMQLVEAGKLKLDDPIGAYLPELAPSTRAVTVRQLLSHQSGLGNFFTPDHLPLLIRARTLRELLPLVVNDTPQFPPGSRFSYSNTGYLLLGLLVEKIAGKPFGDVLQAQIFSPLKMTATSLDPGPVGLRASGLTTLAMSPDHPAPLHVAVEASLMGTSAGGAYSTAEDLEKFLSGLSSGALVKPENFAALIAPGLPPDPKSPLRYGMGFGSGDFESHPWFGHNGGAPGANVEIAVFPKDRVLIIVLSNRDPPLASKLFRSLRDVVFHPNATCSL